MIIKAYDPIAAVNVKIITQPQNAKKGKFHLDFRKLPKFAPEPSSFVPGSTEKMLNVSQNMINNKLAQSDWEQFMQMMPLNDDVRQYIQEHPEVYHVPFADKLFPGIVWRHRPLFAGVFNMQTFVCVYLLVLC